VHAAPASKNNLLPIHVHINNIPLSDPNGNGGSLHLPQNLKCCHSATSESKSSDSDAEFGIPHCQHQRYPQLNLPQYLSILKEHGIIYAESVTAFPKDYYTDLGMADGSVAPFLSGVKRALKQKKKGN
jgi:hypothetical protein